MTDANHRSRVTRLFEHVRIVSSTTLILTIVAYSVAVLLLGHVARVLAFIPIATDFLINPTLLCSLFVLSIVSVFIFGIGRCRPADVGWTTGALVCGVLVTVVFWAAMQVGLVVATALHGEILLNPQWEQSALTASIGRVLGQLLGNAFVEETIFRGFLLPQFYLRSRAAGHVGALIIAVVGSTLLFTVSHIPNLMFIRHLGGTELPAFLGTIFVFGLVHAVIFIVTGNLFVAVGLHTLLNESASLVVASDKTVQTIWFGLMVGLLIGWTAIVRFWGTWPGVKPSCN